MKTISYRKGVVEFRVPSQWKEEYSDSDGGMFYEEGPNSGTLRLKLITVTSPSEVTADLAVSLLNVLRQVQGRAVALPNGNALGRFEETSVDRGQTIKTFYWFLSNPVPPKHARIATFSYTILEDNEHTPQVVQDLKMIDEEVRAAEFSKELGLLK